MTRWIPTMLLACAAVGFGLLGIYTDNVGLIMIATFLSGAVYGRDDT